MLILRAKNALNAVICTILFIFSLIMESRLLQKRRILSFVFTVSCLKKSLLMLLLLLLSSSSSLLLLLLLKDFVSFLYWCFCTFLAFLTVLDLTNVLKTSNKEEEP